MRELTMKSLWFIFVLFLMHIISCGSFNVDIPSRVMHTSPQSGSMFGFSVALYKYKNEMSLLVGAPKYRTNQPGVQRGGAVLNCGTEFDSYCTYVPFDRNGHNVQSLGIQIDNKTDQLFGATVRTSYKDGLVVACAPRYVWFTEDLNKREPVGTCFVASNGLRDFEEYSPCRTRAWGYHKQGSCQAGFDAAIAKNGNTIFIGAPGAYYWQGQVHAQLTIDNNKSYFKTNEGPLSEDDQYMGYSVATGEFNGDRIDDVVLGVPKGLNYTGKIVLYSHKLEWIMNITGDQIGSYFGYSLCVLDFNNDGLDDIVIGAPMYTDLEDREMKIEVGRVHILLQDHSHNFENRISLFGTENKGRFGLSVASIGDINLDDHGDLAVGAPYGGKDGRGVVFIYSGFSKLLKGKTLEDMKTPCQVLRASDFGRNLWTFGWSLSGGLDVDQNQYPDLLVGAFESDRALLLKTRPIIKFIDNKLEFVSESGKINLKKPNCKLPGTNIDTTCLELKFCLTYTGVNVQDSIGMDVEYILDSKKPSEQRLLFQDNQRGSYRERLAFHKNTQKCRFLKTYVNNELEDKLTEISANVSYTLVEQRNNPKILTPVLNKWQDLTLSDSIKIATNCGPDQICIPDMEITVDTPDVFIIGKNEMLTADVRVINKGEDAFESSVYISEPERFAFNKLIQNENTSIDEWYKKEINGSSFIVVDVGNPFHTNQKVSFTIKFQQAAPIEESKFEFLFEAKSINPEKDSTLGNNVIRKTVEAMIVAELVLYGSSEPPLIVYNKTLYEVPLRSHEKHIGPSVIHKYGLLSDGPSDVDEVEIIIVWPSRTLTGNHLLYLMEQPITVGNVRCDEVPDINPLNYETITSEERATLIGISHLESLQGASTSVSSGSSGSSQSITSSSSSSKTHFRGGSGGRSSSSGDKHSSSSSSFSEESYSSSGKNYSSSSKAYFSSSSSSSSTSEGSFSRSGSYSGNSYRTKRDASPEYSWYNLTTQCGRTDCIRIKCWAKNLEENNYIDIYLRSRLYVDTLEEYEFPSDGLTITTRMVTKTKLSADSIKINTESVTTSIKSSESWDRAPPIPWWVILLATLAGLLILLILILILWKCGYFKRHRPRHKGKVNDDAQPLDPSKGSNAFNGRSNYKNSNRPYYPGDEAL